MALILFGKPSAIEAHVPFFETNVVVENRHIRFGKNILDSVRLLCIGEGSILRSRLPKIPAEVLKELVVNAFGHRCYPTYCADFISRLQQTQPVKAGRYGRQFRSCRCACLSGF